MNSTFHLELRDVTVGRSRKTVISGVSATFQRGRVHLLLGRAGSGKTTLLATIAGFLKPLAGTLLWNGEPWNPSGKIGLAFQNPETMFFCASVGEEVAFALRERGIPPDIAEGQGREWLQSWGIDSDAFWDRNPFHLSGGEKRRVALAAATIFKPDIILLDEPLAGLDPGGADVLQQRIGELAREHIVLVVTHDPEELLGSCSQVILLEGGGASVFRDGPAFLHTALQSPARYPLPEWYRLAMGTTNSSNVLPAPVVEDVAAFLVAQPERLNRSDPA